MADHGGIRGVALGLVLRHRRALDQGQQLTDEDRVVGGVVDPSPAEDAVLGGAHEGGVCAVERGVPEGQRDLVDDGLRRRVVRDDEDLDAHLSPGVVEPEAAQSTQLRDPALADVPALARQPLRQQLELAGAQGGAVHLSHGRCPRGP